MIRYYLLIVSPYVYSLIASIIAYIIWKCKSIKLTMSLNSFFKNYIFLSPSWLLSILALCIVPYNNEAGLLETIIASFFVPAFYSLILLLGIYDVSKNSKKESDESN